MILDVIEPQDLEWMRYHRNDPELRKFFREYKDISKSQQAAWYERDGSNNNHKHIYFKIMLSHTKLPGGTWDKDKLVGICGLTNIDWVARRAELSVYLSPQTHGKGIGKDALTTMYNYAFRELNLHSIVAEVYDNNKAVDFYKGALGMTQDGVIRHTYFSEGKYGDSIMLTLLEDEWASFIK